MKHSKSRILAALLCCALLLTACAPSAAPADPTPTQAPSPQPAVSPSAAPAQPEETEPVPEPPILTGAERNAAAMAEHAPQIRTLENGVQVQTVPNDPYLWNTVMLNGENRGCTACHALEDAVQNLTLTHPELWNPYNVDMTVDFCYMCHSKALFICDSMHTLHLNNQAFTDMGGNCMSCHYVDPMTGSYTLWDRAKYNALMGFSSVPNVTGEFTYDQTTLTPTDELFFYWENGDHRGVTPETDTAPQVLQDWTISIEGLVDQPMTFKVSDYMDQSVTRVLKMNCQTNPPGGSYCANCEVTGIPLSILLGQAGVQTAANTLNCVSDDGWVYPLPMSYYSAGNDPLIVYEINGEPLRGIHGYPVQLWTPGLGGVHFTKRLAKIELAENAAEPKLFIGFTNPKTGDFFNKPNCAIFYYTNGQIFPAGQPIPFEGFVDAYDQTVTALEISLDRGKTWTSFPIEGADTDRWVHWNFTWTPENTGSYVLKVRGVSAEGLVSTTPATLMFHVK